MAGIVISYRRVDSRWIVGRIFDRLESHYGREKVFMDIDGIPIGSDFREHLKNILGNCDVLLAIIGPHWLQGADGRNRLNEETDWVRLEIETALAKKIPVIPVLIDDAAIPEASDLPESMRELAYRHAAKIDTGIDFGAHMERLIRAIDGYQLEARVRRSAEECDISESGSIDGPRNASEYAQSFAGKRGRTPDQEQRLAEIIDRHRRERERKGSGEQSTILAKEHAPEEILQPYEQSTKTVVLDKDLTRNVTPSNRQRTNWIAGIGAFVFLAGAIVNVMRSNDDEAGTESMGIDATTDTSTTVDDVRMPAERRTATPGSAAGPTPVTQLSPAKPQWLRAVEFTSGCWHQISAEEDHVHGRYYRIGPYERGLEYGTGARVEEIRRGAPTEGRLRASSEGIRALDDRSYSYGPWSYTVDPEGHLIIDYMNAKSDQDQEYPLTYERIDCPG